MKMLPLCRQESVLCSSCAVALTSNLKASATICNNGCGSSAYPFNNES